MKINFNEVSEVTPEQWAALKERVTGKKLTTKQAERIKIEGSKNKNQPEGVCWNCGKALRKIDVGRRRLCIACY